MPIALLGRGSVTVGTGGITVLGTRAKSSKLLIAAVMVTMCGLLFAVGVLADPKVLGQRKGKVTLATTIALVVGGVAAAIVQRRSKLERWHVLVPWRSVRDVSIGPPTEMIVTIKGTSPSGTLHFAPDAGADAVKRAIAAGKPA